MLTSTDFTKRIILLFVVLLLASAFLPACITTPKLTPLDGADKDAVLKYSEPLADALLAGYNANDYAAFSKDMNEKMKSTLNEDYFKKQIVGSTFVKIGKYESRSVTSVLKAAQYVTVIYNAKFEKDDPVVITMSFDAADPHQISGLYFKSANLLK